MSGQAGLELRLSLWIYFSNQRVFGLEMHVTTFYARLDAEDEAQRPHPALLNAMVSRFPGSLTPVPFGVSRLTHSLGSDARSEVSRRGDESYRLCDPRS